MNVKSISVKRIFIVLGISLFVFSLWIGRLFWLQIVYGKELRQQAAEYRTKTLMLNPLRGKIYDRNNNKLVANTPSFSVYAQPDRIKEREKFAQLVAPILNMKVEDVYKKINVDKSFIYLKHKISLETAQAIKKLNRSEIGLVEGSKRTYKQGSMAAHLLGFVGDDNQGIAGLELSYDQELKGSPGYLITEKDAAGDLVPQYSLKMTPSSPGNNLVLTIDQTIQYFVEKELDQIYADYKPDRASIIVMSPQTGEILALGNRPGFSPEDWENVEQTIWERNTATLFNYEPGSTFKIFLSAAALEEKTVRPTDWFYDPGYIMVNKRRINCDERSGHGSISFVQAVENSCNPVFIQVGLKLGKELFYKYIHDFGFGTSTGVDLPGEENGIINAKDKITDLDLACMSIGQSVSVTPLQLVNALCAVANGGNLMKPHLVKAITDSNGKVVKQVEPQVIRRVISSDTSRELTQMLERVVLKGTGKKAHVEGYRVAGKTGTAQIPGPNGYIQGSYVASFAGFAPVEDPRIAMLVVVVDPKGAYHGGEVAAPSFQKLTSSILAYLGLPEEEDQRTKVKKPEPLAFSRSMITVPNVTGFPAADAGWFLESRGLIPVFSAKQGIVQEQKPGGGSMTALGSTVSLKVIPKAAGNDSSDLTVPDFTGLSLKRAGEICETLGLQPRVKGSGLATGQEPPPGTKVKRGFLVFIEFAN